MDYLEEKMKNKVDIEVWQSITLLLQVVLGVFCITFAIAGVFEKELFMICEILVGLLMFTIAYNNHKLYKRKYMTAVYAGLGVIMIVCSFFA